MSKVVIVFENGIRTMVDLRSDGTDTARRMLELLPISSRANTWGDEVYFSVPFHAALEKDARAEMDVGDVAFWPDGDAVAIFFGPTPSSIGKKPRAYSPCNILGMVEGDPTVLRQVKPGINLRVERQ